MSEYHTPVLLDESISALVTNPSGIYADVTFGGGGHTAEILSRLNEDGHVIAFDRDEDALSNRIDDPRLILIRSDFRFIHNHILLLAHDCAGSDPRLSERLKDGLDGILADLGVSSHQFDTASRGFSFRYDALLDMRMNQEGGMTAADVVGTYSQEDLERILRIYGEVDNSRRVAQLIVSARERGGISTTGELYAAIAGAVPAYSGHKFLAKVFQALRIEVNHEMRSLEKFLEGAAASLKDEGRLAVITYHSLEDRMVKNFIRTGNAGGKEEKDLFGVVSAPFRAVNRKPLLPTREREAQSCGWHQGIWEGESDGKEDTPRIQVCRHPDLDQECIPDHSEGQVADNAEDRKILRAHHLHLLPVLGQHLPGHEDREDDDEGGGKPQETRGHRDIPCPQAGRAHPPPEDEHRTGNAGSKGIFGRYPGKTGREDKMTG